MTRVVLGIETSTPFGGIALADVNGNLISHRWSYSKTGYSRRLMATIDSCLNEGGFTKDSIAAIAVTRGPGSFTGVRVGLTTAKTLAHALGVRLYLFSSLDCAARRWPMQGSILGVMLDARRSEIYSGAYRILGGGDIEILRENKVESCVPFLEWLEMRGNEEIWLSGEATLIYGSEIEKRLGSRTRLVPAPWNRPAADSVVLEGVRAFSQSVPGVDPFLAAPDYLRASDAERNLAMKTTPR